MQINEVHLTFFKSDNVSSANCKNKIIVCNWFLNRKITELMTSQI